MELESTVVAIERMKGNAGGFKKALKMYACELLVSGARYIIKIGK